MNIDEMKDRISRAEEIQRYTENRCKTLEKENAELKRECRRCVYSDTPCILSDYGKDKNGICDHFKDVFDENAELKELLKDKSCLDCKHLHTDLQLTKAKEIIKKLLDAYEYVIRYEEYADREILKQAKQFLNSEVEK